MKTKTSPRKVPEARRALLLDGARGLGAAALASLLPPEILAAAGHEPEHRWGGLSGVPHFAPRANRAISLFMAGGPAQTDLFDHKPALRDMFGEDLPASVRGTQRLTEFTAKQARLPLAPSRFAFAQHGQSGAWVSELLPHIADIVDEIAIVKTAWTEAINHDPAATYIQTGNQQPGKPSLGAWLSYGLGSDNQDLPTYVVLISKYSSKTPSLAVFPRMWGPGFLPSAHQGVALRSSGDPVLYLSNPPGVDRVARREMLDAVLALDGHRLRTFQNPEIAARMAQYEMAFRMQSSVPDLADLSKEPESTFTLYGPEARIPGTFSFNCLLARRLAERGVRFTQVFHPGWDQHGQIPVALPLQCRDVDRASRALVLDLRRRGLLDDTLVVWGGEFGRTTFCQGKLTRTDYGRDHHPRCFTVWLAGGGIRRGCVHGETDDFGYNVARDPVPIRDLNATILHCLGIDHTRLTFKYAGLDQRLTGVEPAKVVRAILAS